MFRRDLTEAGIPWDLPTGERVDFHTLRSTAITWWLDVDGLSQKRVQILARLKTLALVATDSLDCLSSRQRCLAHSVGLEGNLENRT